MFSNPTAQLNQRRTGDRLPHPWARNFTIIVNWKARGFGCAKVCTYCNWRDSPRLPHEVRATQS